MRFSVCLSVDLRNKDAVARLEKIPGLYQRQGRGRKRTGEVEERQDALSKENVISGTDANIT